MTTQPRSRQELYDIYKNEVQDRNENLTDFEDGAINDCFAGATSLAMSEITDLILEKFKNTFFKSADGPEVTLGPDNLQTLAVDHFGDDFARPAASKAVGIVTFSRANTDQGDVVIGSGTIVKTPPDANGNAKRYQTVLNVTMTTTSTNASIEAVDGEEGTRNNADSGTVTKIETTLTDSSVVVTNADPISGGEEAEDDATYRETIFNLIQTLRGATKDAIEAKLLTVPGIEQATIVEFAQNVIEWDDDTETPVGSSFTIPRVKGYIADANGTANDALIASADAAATTVRACGVRIDIFGAVAVPLDWTAKLVLNPSGPNFALFSDDTALIEQTMREYLQGLEIGSDFVKDLADLALSNIWGPSGTNDLVAGGFSTVSPSSDVGTAENEWIIPDEMATI